MALRITKAEILREVYGLEVGQVIYCVDGRLCAGVFTLSKKEAIKQSKRGYMKLWVRDVEDTEKPDTGNVYDLLKQSEKEKRNNYINRSKTTKQKRA